MSDERDDEPEGLPPEGAAPEDTEEEEGEALNPFDHPAFLPVLIAGLSLWFGFDGWWNESIESVDFNRFGFGFLIGAALYFGLSEYTRLRFLLPVLFAVYTVWLYVVGFVAAPDAFAREASAVLFSKYATGFTAGAFVWALALEAYRSRWLLPLLFVGYAAALAAMPSLGSEQSWWNAHDSTSLVHDVGAGVCLATAVVLALRALFNKPADAARDEAPDA